MTFEEILDHAIAMLQRRGRLTYGTLKRQFQLDDAALEDLKHELIKGQRLVRDEDGEVLVWTGGTSSVTPTASPVPLPATPDVSPAQGEAAAVAPPTPEAERRQLTVMFCDLVESTKLSSQLDPEEYRDVVRAYHTACTEVIRRYDGHIAQLLGDGLLVYFGYPQAHEDDAQRAVRTGLGILAAVGDLNRALQQTKGLHLALRLGIHTGLVVVGDMGSTGRQEHLALGETPNVAARMQGLAAPNTLVISEVTSRLVQGYFECQALGAQRLRGVPESVRVYQVLRASGATSRLDIAQPKGLTPLVGRESEVTLLLERWEQAKSGQGQVVLLRGDAGIGKSRLVQMLKQHVVNQPHTCWECRSLAYFDNTALFPLTDLFQRLLRFQTEDTPDEKCRKLEHVLSQYRLPLEESVPLLAPLLSLPLPEHHYPPLHLSPQRQRQKTLETIVAILLEQAERQPVLCILEDLHWTDPSTLELLHLVIDQTPTAAVLVLLTCRPYFQTAWPHRSYLTEMTVNRLAQPQIARMVERIADGKLLPPEVLQQIIAKTDGVPLFVEELTKVLLESGQLKAVNGHYDLVGTVSTFAIPATLQDSLMARLDRLVTAKGIAQLAAVLGRQFAYDLLQAVSQLDAMTLQRELGRLVEAELVYQRGVPPQSTYVFKHALIQEAAYESLLKSTRQHYHRRIAHVLETRFVATAETQPERLAHHYTEAGLGAQAVTYWQQAGQRAMERSAPVEAISHLTCGLEVLTTMPETPERLRHELDLQIPLGAALAQTRGWSALEVGQAYARARLLCERLGTPSQLSVVLLRQFLGCIQRAECQMARELAEHLLTLAQRQTDPVLLLSAHATLGITLFFHGEVATAHAHLARGITLYVPAYHRTLVVHHGPDLGVFVRCYAAHCLWLLGAPEQAMTRMQEAHDLAQELSHPYSLAYALLHMTRLCQWRRDVQATLTWTKTLMALSIEHRFEQFLFHGKLWHGWALVAQGQGDEGLDQMRQSLTAYLATGATILQPYFLALLAEGYRQVGAVDEGLRMLAEALEVVQETGERVWEAELHQLKGELILQARCQPLGPRSSLSHTAEAEVCFHQALVVARCQQAKSLELRAATSLARLWQQQGKRAEAHSLLAPIYGWFTEGFDTADLQEAKVLLEALA